MNGVFTVKEQQTVSVWMRRAKAKVTSSDSSAAASTHIIAALLTKHRASANIRIKLYKKRIAS